MFFLTEKGRLMRLVSRLSRLRARHGNKRKTTELNLLRSYFMTAGDRFLDPGLRAGQISEFFRSLEREMTGLFSEGALRSVFFDLADQLLAEAPAFDSRRAWAAQSRLLAFAWTFMRGAPELDEAIRLFRETRRLPALYAFDLARSLSGARLASACRHRPITGQLTLNEIEAFIERIIEEGEPGALDRVYLLLSSELVSRKSTRGTAA